MKHKKTLIFILLFSLFSFCSQISMSQQLQATPEPFDNAVSEEITQERSGPDPGCDPDRPFDPPCPIDGGLSLLIAAGIGFAGKRAYQHKKAVK